MGWTAGELEQPFTSRAGIAFDLGEDFAERVIDTARVGRVIYAAVRTADGRDVFGLVLLTERCRQILYTKPISEDMGPAEDGCPARILDKLTAPGNTHAREWRKRCRARLARPRPKPGQRVVFSQPLKFTSSDEHRVLIFQGGSRFRSADGQLYHVRLWRDLDYSITPDGSSA
jgi:hypothetical protein